MAHPATLLLTRPWASSERFAIQVRAALGFDKIVISPLLDIAFHTIKPPESGALLVFTSRSGIEAWARSNLSTRHCCICVGQASAEAARALGFDAIASGGTVEHVYADIINAAPKGEIIHIHGRHTRGDLARRLTARGLNAKGLTAYEQKLCDLSVEAQALLKGGTPVIVPLFSPRSAAQFAKMGPFGPQIDVVAISKTAADACFGARVAPFPSAEGVIAAISQGSTGPS